MRNYETTDAPSVEREALCGETSYHAKRLAEINLAVDNLITRITGPRPSQVAKDEKQPNDQHLREWSRRVGLELCTLEQNVSLLQQLIG